MSGARAALVGPDTSSTRRKLAGFYDDVLTESLGIAPDGRRLTIAVRRGDRGVMLAEDVAGLR